MLREGSLVIPVFGDGVRAWPDPRKACPSSAKASSPGGKAFLVALGEHTRLTLPWIPAIAGTSEDDQRRPRVSDSGSETAKTRAKREPRISAHPHYDPDSSRRP